MARDCPSILDPNDAATAESDVDLHWVHTFNEDNTQVLISNSNAGSQWIRWFTWPKFEFVSDYGVYFSAQDRAFDSDGNAYASGGTLVPSVEFRKHDAISHVDTVLFSDTENGNAASYEACWNQATGQLFAFRRNTSGNIHRVYLVDHIAGGRTLLNGALPGGSTLAHDSLPTVASDGSMWILTTLLGPFQLVRIQPDGTADLVGFIFPDQRNVGAYLPTDDGKLLVSGAPNGTTGTPMSWYEVDCSSLAVTDISDEVCDTMLGLMQNTHVCPANDFSVLAWRGEIGSTPGNFPRYLLRYPGVFEEPWLRQRQRDDVVRAYGGRNSPTSIQASIRRGPNAYV